MTQAAPCGRGWCGGSPFAALYILCQNHVHVTPCYRWGFVYFQVVVQSQLAVVLHNMATCPADVWASAAVSTALVALLDLLQVHDGCVSLTACAPLVFGTRLRMLLHTFFSHSHTMHP